MAVFTGQQVQALQRIIRAILNNQHIELMKIRILKTRVSFYLYDVNQDKMALLDQIVSHELRHLNWYSWRSGLNVLSVAKEYSEEEQDG